MIEARVYRGIEFIRISELPEDQQQLIKQWAVNGTIIKILMDNKLLPDCIQYKDYCFWFENVYIKVLETESQPAVKKPAPASVKLAMGR